MGLKKNIINNTVLTTSSVVISFITFPYITRTLSPENMGSVLFIDAFTQYFVIFSSLGIPYYGVREVAKLNGNPEEQSRLVASLVSLQFILSVLLTLAFLSLSLFIPELKENRNLVILGCLTMLSSSFAIEWFYQGIEHFSYITKRALIIRLLSLIAIFFLIKKANDHYLYYLISFGVIFLNAVLNFGNYLLRFFRTFRGKIAIMPHIRPLMVLFSINISISVYAILDTIILGLFTDPVNVSYYSIPLKLVKIVWVVVGGFSVVLIPRISKYFLRDDISEVAALLKKSLSLVFLLTMPFAFLCIFFPREILFAVFGDKYLKAELSLQILSIVPLIIGVCNVFGTQFLLPIGHEKKILHATIFGLVASLALNFSLVPHLKHVGSSIACIAAESIVCLYVFLIARNRIAIRIDYSLILMTISASAFSVVAGMFLKVSLNDYNLLVALCMIYVLVFAAFQFLIFKNQFIYYLLRIKSST
jgi:O-antigen/teichoic acid export membrane protein